MTVYKCDCCGKRVSKLEELSKVQFRHSSLVLWDSDYLCQYCYDYLSKIAGRDRDRRRRLIWRENHGWMNTEYDWGEEE